MKCYAIKRGNEYLVAFGFDPDGSMNPNKDQYSKNAEQAHLFDTRPYGRSDEKVVPVLRTVSEIG